MRRETPVLSHVCTKVLSAGRTLSHKGRAECKRRIWREHKSRVQCSLSAPERQKLWERMGSKEPRIYTLTLQAYQQRKKVCKGTQA